MGYNVKVYKVTLIQGNNDMAFKFMSLEKALSFVETAIDNGINLETPHGSVEVVAEVEKIEEPF